MLSGQRAFCGASAIEVMNAILKEEPYAVTADGQRFLINAVMETEPNAPLTVVVNLAAEINRGAK